jgi:hypothetical protein
MSATRHNPSFASQLRPQQLLVERRRLTAADPFAHGLPPATWTWRAQLRSGGDQLSGFVQTTDVSVTAYPARSYRRSAPVALPVSTVSTDRS